MPKSKDSNADVFGLARRSIAGYAPMMFPRFEVAAHHSKLISKLEAVERGEIRRLMILMPPRHGKSLLATQIFPAWFLGRNPSKSVITATYSQDLSDDFGRVVRNFVNDPFTRRTFPELIVSEDSNSMKRFTTSEGGAYYAVGAGAAITGRGADLLIIDDPIKGMEEARSENVRHSLHEWFSSVAYTRLQPNGAIVIIQTAWHFDDLAHWLLREHPEENWDVLNLPAIAERDEDGRREGAALWPERFSEETLASIKVAVGGATWAALYQQRPTAADGEVFKREWWRYYVEIPPLKRIVQSWDTAFKSGSQNDYSVGTTWGESATGYYLLDLWKGRIEFPELKRRVALQAKEWRPSAILIEDKASGQSLIQELKESTSFPVLAIKVDSDKISRAYAASPTVEAGKVYLPKNAPWLADYLYNMSTFPVGAHDDDVDSTTQALNFMRGSNLSYGLLDFYKEVSLVGASSRKQLEAAINIKPAVERPEGPENKPLCPECGSDFLQKISVGKRCGACGLCFGGPSHLIDSRQKRAV